MKEVIIPAEQIDTKQYWYPSGDEITDTRRKIGVWLKWNYFTLFNALGDLLTGEERDAHARLVDFTYDTNTHTYKALVN